MIITTGYLKYLPFFKTNYFIFFIDDYEPIEFVTLKDGSEGLLIRNNRYEYKFIDPFHPSNAVDITNDIITDDIKIIFNNEMTRF